MYKVCSCLLYCLLLHIRKIYYFLHQGFWQLKEYTRQDFFFFFFNVSIPNFYDHLPWLCLWFLMQKIQEFHMSRWEALTTESFCSMWLILVSPLFEGCKVYSSDLMNPLTSSLQIHKCSDLQMLQNHRHIGDARSINNVNKDHHNWIGILQARNIIFPCNL